MKLQEMVERYFQEYYNKELIPQIINKTEMEGIENLFKQLVFPDNAIYYFPMFMELIYKLTNEENPIETMKIFALHEQMVGSQITLDLIRHYGIPEDLKEISTGDYNK